MDFKKLIGLLTLFILLGGLAGGVVLIRRQQRVTSRATDQFKSSSPKVYSREDFNKDGLIDSRDLVIFQQRYQAADPSADLDNSGEVNSLDYNLFLSKMR